MCDELRISYLWISDLRVRRSWAGRSPVQWHTDQSPEPQTPGTTFICMLESPAAAGGDTLVSSSVQAYKSLSPQFRKRLEGLTAIHSNNDGFQSELQNGEKAVLRRGIIESEHPVVIVHPVTREKALCELLPIARFRVPLTHLFQTSTLCTQNESLDTKPKSRNAFSDFSLTI